jgi:cadmium resistance protein CadD (predicted permease)
VGSRLETVAAAVAVFAAGIAAWCLAGSWLGSHKDVIRVVRRFGHWIVPGIFVLIGAVIVVGSGVLSVPFPRAA